MSVCTCDIGPYPNSVAASPQAFIPGPAPKVPLDCPVACAQTIVGMPSMHSHSVTRGTPVSGVAASVALFGRAGSNNGAVSVFLYKFMLAAYI